MTGVRGQRVEIAMMRTPDGHGRIELSRFETPAIQSDHRTAPGNSLGYLRVMFAVDDIDDTLARLGKIGATVVDEVVFEQPIALAPKEFKKIRLEFAAADLPGPPLTTLPVEVSGTFLTGFELSHFLPDDWKRCGLGSPDDWIWVGLDEDDDAKFVEPGTYQVRWRGVLEGPGRYGHLDASDYLLLVEEVREATLVAKPSPPVRYPLPRGLAEHLKKFQRAWRNDDPLE